MEHDDGLGWQGGAGRREGYRRASIWMATPDGDALPALEQDMSVDVVVIGGGMTGISTALQLLRSGRRVVVLEAGHVGWSNTGHSTGNLYATVSDGLYALGQKWGDDVAEAVVRSRSEAIGMIERNIAEFQFSCGFSREPWALYTTGGGAAESERITREYDAARGAGLKARLANDLPLPYPVKKAVVVSDQAQFNPYLYVRRLAAAIRGAQCRIFENTPVIEVDIDRGIVRTARHQVRADHIVMATHTPKGISILHTELLPYRECGIAARMNERQLEGGIFWQEGAEANSTRLTEIDGQSYVVMIGEKHRTGYIEEMTGAYERLEATLRTRFKTDVPAFRWSAQQYRSGDGLPYIGSSVGSAHVYIATGFGADGLTYGALSGMLLADEICGNENIYAGLYSARRFTPIKSAKNFLKENMDVAGSFIKDYAIGSRIKDLANVPSGQGSLVELNGEKLAAYRDENDQLHVVSAACTHLKCIVHWNQSERSWDCPCHGSRFHYDGSVIEGPAIAPLKRYVRQPAADNDLPAMPPL
jgi:glycine/D-amino acid oxidase-like deaminating enzyme/nitrite reductase/ring-hydroxylating ferredoxin subunit